MPRVMKTSIKIRNPMQSFKGEVPRTTFINMERSVAVQVIHESDPILPMNEMLQATHSAIVPGFKIDKRLDDMLKGAGMWMLSEIPQFILKITGVSRIFTHQLVRQRIGVTFMQQCTGDTDFRHANIIVPGCIAADLQQWIYFNDACLQAKNTYAEMLDSHIPVQSARYVLPMAIETYIYMQVSLAAAVALYQKRICPMSQTWEMVLFAQRMKNAICDSDMKWLQLFDNPCKKNACWWNKAKFAGTWTPLWQPDAAHDLFEWDDTTFVYAGTNRNASSPEEVFLPRAYVGYAEVTN